MKLFQKLNLPISTTIDWKMTPEYTFGTFESWGGKERIRSKAERIYYFFIDNWGPRPRLLLMERGIKYAKILAEISAPPDLVHCCVAEQGKSSFEKNFAINEEIKNWLIQHVLETDDAACAVPIPEEQRHEVLESGLPLRGGVVTGVARVVLPDAPEELSEEALANLIRNYDMLDLAHHAQGKFCGYLVDNGDALSVSDLATGLMWQRQGLDIMSHRMMAHEIERLNDQGYAGHHDWRLPSLLEALSLLRPEQNSRGLYLHPCFSASQPFIFTNTTRHPGGYWFVDYKQGRSFWASGTIPGGFGRLCRREK